jgi:DNA-binding NarL/FixJ family response regulator
VSKWKQIYYDSMTRVYLADAQLEERSALKLLMLDLHMDVIGEAADWATTIKQAPKLKTDLLLVDWDMLPHDPPSAIKRLRSACPAALVIILISHMDSRQQAALSAGADTFISKEETPQRMVERLKMISEEMLDKRKQTGDQA